VALSQNKLSGWNTDQIQSVVKMVKENPEAGRIRFQTRSKWDGGFGVDSHTEEIGMLNQAVPRKFTLRGDHPQELLGMNTGPTAVETLFAALGSCIAGTYAAQATARGINIDDLEVEVDGSIDLQGFFQLAPIRAGPSEIKVNVRVKSDNAEKSKLLEFHGIIDNFAQNFSL
jgi:uncharacterized OsmC-like protein